MTVTRALLRLAQFGINTPGTITGADPLPHAREQSAAGLVAILWHPIMTLTRLALQACLSGIPGFKTAQYYDIGTSCLTSSKASSRSCRRGPHLRNKAFTST